MKPVQMNNLVRQGLKNRRLKKGTLEVVFTDSSGEVISYYPSVVRYQVVDDQGRVVEGEFNASYNERYLPRLAFWYLYSQDHPI